MQAYSELLPPTAVTHALKLPFLKPHAENLIVAKTSLIQIFEATPALPTKSQVGNTSHGHQAPNGDVASTKPQANLVLISEYSLSGTITSLARIKASNTKSGGEALLISFKNAKVSLVEWDPATFSISTISIHTYENEDLLRNSWIQELSQYPSFLTSDPSSRAAALKLGQRHIAVIPFKQLGDELATGDLNPDLDATAPSQSTSSRQNGEPRQDQTPYGSSFVLSLTALDPNIVRPVDLAFLYEYREPTLGVVSATTSPSSSVTEDREDVLTYTVFTLDLGQEARTILQSVQNLPSDIFKLQPLPKPVGGALLVGGNEILHVDQAGKTHAVAVNDYARQISSFPMVDQSNLGLKLEGCIIEPLSSKNGDVIMFLASGEIVLVSFHIDGRSVSGLSLKRVKQTSNEEMMRTSVSCAVALDKDLMFIGSKSTNALLLRYSTQRTMLSRKRSHADMLGVEDERSDQDMNEAEVDDDDDDLYAGDTKMTNGHSVQHTDNTAENFVFTVEDTLLNLTSTGEPCIAPDSMPRTETSGNNAQEDPSKVKIALATGRGEESRLTFISKHVNLSVLRTLPFSGVQKTWCLGAVGTKESSTNGTYHTPDSNGQNHDQLMITTGFSDGNASSRLYDLKSGGISEVQDSYFDNETTTLNAGLLCNGKRIVQVSQNEVRCLDSDLALSQILPMLDESTDSELSIVQTSFCDPYLLVVRSDASIVVFGSDDREDQLEELDRGEIFSSRKWSSGCLYMPRSARSNTLAFMLTIDGTLCVFQLPDLETSLYQVEAVNLMPPLLSPENLFRRAPNREKIVEIMVADIGVDTLVFPVLVLRTADDNLALYRPFQSSSAGQENFINPALKWVKVVDTSLTKTFGFGNENTQELSPQTLRIIPNIGDYRAIFVASKTPRIIVLEPSSMPKIVEINDKPIDLSSIHTPECSQGAIFTNQEGEAMFSHLPSNTRFGEAGLAVRQTNIGSRIECLCYHPASDLFVLGINDPAPFKLPEDDDWHQEWAKDDHSFPPTGNVAKLKLFDPKSNSIIHEVTLDTDEVVMTLKHTLLEVSEITHEQKSLIAVGTAVTKGEDLPSNGNVCVFDIVNVVPNPDRPETNRSLKEISREEVKGAVTSLSEIGMEGLLLNAQGQKCMVRGLKEDNSMLPVAFLDVQCDVMALRNIKGTGLALIGDILKGVWLVAFMTDPFRMNIFAKNRNDMNIVSTEFLPQKQQLFILAADDGCNLNVLEFNPEDPKSVSGQRLLQRNVFYTGHFPVSMVKLPVPSDLPESTSNDGDTHMEEDDDEPTTQDYNILLTTESGAVATITPLDEPTYRRLAALQIYLTGVLDHRCGLNPRIYRAIDSESFGNRGILDGQLLKRWFTLSSQRKAEACTRVGADVWQIREDLEMIGGAGMDYL